MAQVSVTVNDEVSVVLTEEGAKAMNTFRRRKYKATDGFVSKGERLRLPLWQIMQIFGSTSEKPIFVNGEICV